MKAIEELIELATETGLDATAAELSMFPLADAFQGIEKQTLEAPAPELPLLLQQCARRGFDPALTAALLSHFRNKPLERGLIAWDVLSQTLWPQDEDEVFAELQEALREVEDVRPKNSGELGLDLATRPAVDVLAQFASSANNDLLEGMKQIDLSSIAIALKGNGKESTIARSAALTNAVHSMGRLLGLAHLPTLASLYLDFAARGLGHRPSALSLCDIMFDVKAGSRLPEDGIRKGDVPPEQLSDLLEYIIYRAKIDAGERLSALSLAKTNLERRGDVPLSPRLAVVFADLAQTVRDVGPPPELLDRACADNELWSYAWRVRASFSALFVGAGSDSLRPLERCAEYVGRFGNNWRMWYDAFQNTEGAAPWKTASCALVGREVLTLPYNEQAWRTLIIQTAPDEDTIRACLDELEEQLDGQTEWES